MPNYNYSLSSKLPKVGTTIFTTMSALANEEKAINLSQGFPDFGIDANLIDLVTKHMKLGANQYAPMPGSLQLREALVDKMDRLYQVQYNVNDEVTVTGEQLRLFIRQFLP